MRARDGRGRGRTDDGAEMRSTDERRARRSIGVLACLDGYMNIAMEQTEVRSARARGGGERDVRGFDDARETRRARARRDETDDGVYARRAGVRERTVDE